MNNLKWSCRAFKRPPFILRARLKWSKSSNNQSDCSVGATGNLELSIKSKRPIRIEKRVWLTARWNEQNKIRLNWLKKQTTNQIARKNQNKANDQSDRSNDATGISSCQSKQTSNQVREFRAIWLERRVGSTQGRKWGYENELSIKRVSRFWLDVCFFSRIWLVVCFFSQLSRILFCARFTFQPVEPIFYLPCSILATWAEFYLCSCPKYTTIFAVNALNFEILEIRTIKQAYTGALNKSQFHFLFKCVAMKIAVFVENGRVAYPPNP